MKTVKLLSFVCVIITLAGSCKKDEVVTLYPKTFTQISAEQSFQFRVHNQLITPPPTIETFYSASFLQYQSIPYSFTLVSADTLVLNTPRNLPYAYVLRNDTLYYKKTLSLREFNDTTFLVPFAYGNYTQFTILETYFAYMPASKQNDALYELPIDVKSNFSYSDYNYFTDTAALLTYKRVLR